MFWCSHYIFVFTVLVLLFVHVYMNSSRARGHCTLTCLLKKTWGLWCVGLTGCLVGLLCWLTDWVSDPAYRYMDILVNAYRAFGPVVYNKSMEFPLPKTNTLKNWFLWRFLKLTSHKGNFLSKCHVNGIKLCIQTKKNLFKHICICTTKAFAC